MPPATTLTTLRDMELAADAAVADATARVMATLEFAASARAAAARAGFVPRTGNLVAAQAKLMARNIDRKSAANSGSAMLPNVKRGTDRKATRAPTTANSSSERIANWSSRLDSLAVA